MCVCVGYSSILSCVSFVGVSKGNGAVVTECAFAVFGVYFPANKAATPVCGGWTLTVNELSEV